MKKIDPADMVAEMKACRCRPIVAKIDDQQKISTLA